MSGGTGAADDPGVPVGLNKARSDAVALAELAANADFADIAYDSGQQATATTDYTRFINGLATLVNKDCAG